MSENDLAERQRIYAEQHQRLKWREVDTVFADGCVGIANANGIMRMTFVREVFNMDVGATLTAFEPAIVLAVPSLSMVALAHEIINNHNQAVADAEAQQLAAQEGLDATKQ